MEKTVYIYMIRPTICYEEGECYIGSTVKKLNIRFNEHKCHSKFEKWCNSKILFDKFTADFLEIIELRKCNENNRKNIESHFIRKFKCVNKCIPNRNRKEYLHNNKEYFKTYYESNKQKFQEINKKFYKNNPEYFKTYYQNNKQKIQEQQKNYDKNIYTTKYYDKDYKKKYYNEKKEKLEKNICYCGSIYNKLTERQHLQTNKHKKYLENNNIILKNNNIL